MRGRLAARFTGVRLRPANSRAAPRALAYTASMTGAFD
jgi:hypothetical protein